MRLSLADSAVGGWCALLDVWEKISSGRVDVNIKAPLDQRIGLYPAAKSVALNFKSSP